LVLATLLMISFYFDKQTQLIKTASRGFFPSGQLHLPICL
jgi:hypothetical protein